MCILDEDAPLPTRLRPCAGRCGRPARSIAALVIATALSACGGTPGSVTPEGAGPASQAPAARAGASPAAASTIPGSATSSRAAKPFALTYARDDTRAVSKRIEAEDGGTLEVTNAAGDLIRLQIPRDTLLYDETLTLTPLEGIGGIDGATRLVGVAMEPSGVKFTSPAVLVVTPKDALAGDTWWFESLPGSDGRPVRPALPLEGQSGMHVWHFSTGAVATGGPGLSDAVRSRAIGEIPLSERVSSEFLEWRRNQAEQDYQAGRIDKLKRDTDLGIIQDLEEQLAAESIKTKTDEIYQSLADAAATSAKEIRKVREVAARGDPKDVDALSEVMLKALGVERQRQLLGLDDGEAMRAVMDLMGTYAEAVARNCGKRRDMGVETAVFLMSFERQLQLLGSGIADGDRRLLTDCLDREWSGGEQKEGNYGPVTVKVRKSTCGAGIWGTYTYEVTGAVTGSFEFEAKAPRDNFVTFTPFTLNAKVAPKWTDRTYSCTQSGELAIAMPPGAFFKATTRPGRCATDDLGTAAIMETTAFPMRAGPLCK